MTHSTYSGQAPMNTDEFKNEMMVLSDRCPSVSSVATRLLPVPNAPISVRAATRADIPFIDGLQKQYGKALGFFPRAQLEGYIDNGWMLIAEEGPGVGGQGLGNAEEHSSSLTPDLRPLTPRPLAYVASRDRYLKRDELGVIYQMCVSPAAQRGLVAATLLKAVFERSAYGCKLYCCWCAQDLAANKFWEAMGFVPIAFRTGGARGRGSGVRKGAENLSPLTPGPRPLTPRTHIYWQKRIRDDATPYWYPSETGGGAIKENRLVLPMPLGMRWDEAVPVLLPGAESGGIPALRDTQPGLSLARRAKHGLRTTHGTRAKEDVAAAKPSTVRALSRPGFGALTAAAIVPVDAAIVAQPAKPREKKAAAKNDPALVKKARDLRDRWFEQVNADPYAIVPTAAKYALGGGDVTRVERVEPMIDAIIDVAPLTMLAA